MSRQYWSTEPFQITVPVPSSASVQAAAASLDAAIQWHLSTMVFTTSATNWSYTEEQTWTTVDIGRVTLTVGTPVLDTNGQALGVLRADGRVDTTQAVAKPEPVPLPHGRAMDLTGTLTR